MDYKIRSLLKDKIMKKKEFKQSLTEVLNQYGFYLKGNNYILRTKDLIIVIATQKSNFDNSYYINYGFLIKSLNPNLTKPKDNDCDVFGRFIFNINGNVYNSVNIDDFDTKEFSLALTKCIENVIKPIIDNGLKKYFEIYPEAINVVSLKVKEYLEI
jgi:hypothetical protein